MVQVATVRTAIYARVSSDRQEQEQTIQSQLEALRSYAWDKGYEVVGEYLDDGVSGATLERPGLDQVRDQLTTADFEVVLDRAIRVYKRGRDQTAPSPDRADALALALEAQTRRDRGRGLWVF